MLFIQENNSEKNEIYQLNEDIFKYGNLADTYDRYGQEVGHYNAGDYSLYNSACDAESNCITEILEKFFTPYADIDCDIDYGGDGWNFTCNVEIDINLKHEIESFIDRWENENANYIQVKGYTYWNGNKWQSIIIEDEHNEPTHNIIEETEELKNAIENKQEIKKHFGTTIYKSDNGKYLVIETQNLSFENYTIIEADSWEAEQILNN